MVSTYTGLLAASCGSEAKIDGLGLDFGHSDGSWRHMFICQPPCERVDISLTTECVQPFGVIETHKLFHKDDTGVRLGGLHDCISLNLARGMALRKPREQTRTHLRVQIRKYCEARCVTLEDTMVVPARDGVAFCPEYLLWKSEVEE